MNSRNIPRSPVIKTARFHCRVQSLARELGTQMMPSVAKKNKKIKINFKISGS